MNIKIDLLPSKPSQKHRKTAHPCSLQWVQEEPTRPSSWPYVSAASPELGPILARDRRLQQKLCLVVPFGVETFFCSKAKLTARAELVALPLVNR